MPQRSAIARIHPGFRLQGVRPQVFTGVAATPLVKPAVVHPASPMLRPPVTGHIGMVTLVRPNLGLLISQLPVLQTGQPREKIQGPLTTLAEPTDEVLFEDAANPQAKLYLPRYRVAQEMVSGQARFRIRLEQQGQGGTLTVFLEKFPAPALGEAARSATELAHSVALKLVARIPVGGSQVQQELQFQEVTVEGSLLRAVIRLEGLEQVTQVFQILSDSAFSASFVMIRAFRVAVPVPAGNSAESRQVSEEIRKLEVEVNALNPKIHALAAQKTQFQRVGAFGGPAAHMRLVALQQNMAVLTTQRNAKNQQLQLKRGELSALQNQKLYRVAQRALERAVPPLPFVFPQSLHGYVFGALTPTPGGKIGLTSHQVAWQGRSHSYYQQQLQPHRFYFLPDSFKIARRPQTPHNPIISVKFPNPDAPQETMPVTLEYVAAPFVDSDRLEEAATELKRKLPELASQGLQVEFEPLLCDGAKLSLMLPRGESGPQLQEQTQATVDLRSGIFGAFTLPMKEFQGVFDALFGASAVVFQGEVVLPLDDSGGLPSEKVPVICRLDDLAGDIFDFEETPDPSSGGVRMTLRNAIESPAEIRGLTAMLVRNQETQVGVIQGLSFESPIVLKPGEAVSFSVAPKAPLGGDGPIRALFDLDEVFVKPDTVAVWDAVVDKTRLPELTDTIQVRTFKHIFEPKPENPSDPVLTVVIDFERGDSIALTVDKLETEAKIRLSLADYVLRELATGEYRYKVTVIRVESRTQDAEWRKDTTKLLFPDVRVSQASPG